VLAEWLLIYRPKRSSTCLSHPRLEGLVSAQCSAQRPPHAPQLSLHSGVSVRWSTLSKHRTRHSAPFKQPATLLRLSNTVSCLLSPLSNTLPPSIPPSTSSHSVLLPKRSTANPTPVVQPQPQQQSLHLPTWTLDTRHHHTATMGLFKKKEKAAPAASNPCTSQPSSIDDTSDAQQTPPHPARTPTHNRRHSTPAPTTDTARTRRLP
jgi:hypothetical protein